MQPDAGNEPPRLILVHYLVPVERSQFFQSEKAERRKNKLIPYPIRR